MSKNNIFTRRLHCCYFHHWLLRSKLITFHVLLSTPSITIIITTPAIVQLINNRHNFILLLFGMFTTHITLLLSSLLFHPHLITDPVSCVCVSHSLTSHFIRNWNNISALPFIRLSYLLFTALYWFHKYHLLPTWKLHPSFTSRHPRPLHPFLMNLREIQYTSLLLLRSTVLTFR